MKKGLSALAIILMVIIIMVFTFIIISLTTSYIQSKSSEKINQTIKTNSTNEDNSTNKDLNYYLPAEFAAIRLTRGYFEANVTGVLISFEDNSKTYEYNSTEYPGVEGTRTYTILKDQLLPKVPEDWDFTKVKKVYLRYLLSEGKPSAIISTVEINANQTIRNLGESCSSSIIDGKEQVLCE